MDTRDRVAAVLTVVAIVCVTAGIAWAANPAVALIAFGVMVGIVGVLLASTDTEPAHVEGEAP